MLLSDICNELTLAELKEKSKAKTKVKAKSKAETDIEIDPAKGKHLDTSKLDAKSKLALRKAIIATPMAKGDPMAAMLTQLGDKVKDNTETNKGEQEELDHNQEILQKHEEQLAHIDRAVHRANDEVAQLKDQVNKLLRNR